MAGSVFSRALTRLVLPAPEGALTMYSMPSLDRGVMVVPFRLSFNILDLFAHLLDQHVEFERVARGFHRHRFRAQGIGFAVQFLHQEVEALAAGTCLDEHAAHLGKMC